MYILDSGSIWKSWTIESLIGEGSFGKVYRIVRKEFGHEYESALKVIRVPHNSSEVASIKSEGMSDDSITSYYQGMIQDIVAEFALMSELRGNSNIVSYEDHEVIKLKDEFGWDIFVRMELLTPLYTYMNEHPMSERDVVKLGIDMCKALEVCRQFNIIHRDIKPENIFVSDQGSFKLGDFGISKQLDKATVAMSKKGTYVYMAPEVYKGEPYDHTVDIYSLAIVLYRFLNGNRTPFMPPASQPIRFQDKDKATVRRMTGETIPAPCDAHEELAGIILKACAYDPKDRFREPAEMREALEKLYAGKREKKAGEISASSGVKFSLADDEPSEDEDQTLPWDAAVDEAEEQTLPMDATSGEKEEQTLPWDAMAEEAEEQTLPMDAIPDDIDELTLPLVEDEDLEANKSNRNEVASSVDIPEIPDEKIEANSRRINTKLIALIIAVIVVAAGAVGVHSYIESNKTFVPDVVGMKEDKAQTEIELAGLIYNETREFSKEVKRGKVISQSIDAEKSVKKGTEIVIVVSRGKAKSAPRLRKYLPKTSERIAEQKGFKMEIAGEEYSDDVPEGYICRQVPDIGEDCEKGQTIKVYLSKGIEQVTVPDVTGSTPDKARPIIMEAGLKMKVLQEHNDEVPSGQIIKQSPKAGETANHSSTVTVTVSIGSADVSLDE